MSLNSWSSLNSILWLHSDNTSSGMLVEAAFPIVSNFLAAVADRTLWRAMFVGMARTSDGNYNLML